MLDQELPRGRDRGAPRPGRHLQSAVGAKAPAPPGDKASHPVAPAGQVKQVGALDHACLPGRVARAAVGVHRGRPGMLGHGVDRLVVGDALVDLEGWSVSSVAQLGPDRSFGCCANPRSGGWRRQCRCEIRRRRQGWAGIWPVACVKSLFGRRRYRAGVVTRSDQPGSSGDFVPQDWRARRQPCSPPPGLSTSVQSARMPLLMGARGLRRATDVD